MHEYNKPLGNGDQSGNSGQQKGLPWIPVHAGSVLAVIIFFSACIPIVYLWDRASKALDQEMRMSLLETAQSAALLINGDLHATFTTKEQERDKDYLVQVAKLRRFMLQNPRLASLSTYVFHDGAIHVVLDTARSNSGHENGGQTFIMDVHPNPSPEIFKTLQEHTPVVEQTPYTNQWGTFISGYAPIYDRREKVIAAIGADISIEELAMSKSFIRRSAIIGLGLAFLCSVATGLGVHTLRRKMTMASREARSAQEARKAAEFRYQHLFDQIPIGVINYNNDMIITDCNERILSIGNVSRDDLIGMNLNRLEKNRVLPCLKDALHNRESVYIGEYNLTDGAENTWVEIHAGPIKDSSNDLAGGIATIEDITMRHRAEMMSEAEKNLLGMIARGDALETVLAQLILSIESLMPGCICSVCMLDKEKKHLNRGIGPNLPDEYLDCLAGMAIGPNVGSCGTAAYSGKPTISVDLESDPRWQNFKEIAIRYNLRSCWSMPIMSGKDNIYGTFAIYHDHPYKPNAFEKTLLENASFLAGIAVERSLFELAIFEERNLLRTLIDNIPDVVFIKDRFHKYLAANNAAFTWLDISDKATLIGKTDEDFLPAETAIANHKVEERILGGAAEIDHESVVTDSSGNITFISTSRMPVRNASNEIIGLVTIGRNVTDQKRVEEERIKTQKLESLGILAGGIAHDFNNILTSILGNLSFVSIGEKSMSKDSEELLKEAETATQRAKELTQQLLTFAKGGLPVKKPSNIAELVKEAATFALRGSSSKVEFNFSDDLWMAEIDGGQISQVIQNLLFNAEQAMPGGGTISVSGENTSVKQNNTMDLPQGRYVSISVLDHGTGIPEQVQKRIFDPYFTTKKAGNGLGLTTTFSIINKHGGYISVESTSDKGTTFTFLLPALAAALKEKPKAFTAANDGEAAHVLLMDDEEAILKISSRILEQAGFKVSIAHDGKEAVRIYSDAEASEAPVDVAVLDLTIPGGMGGKETFDRLKSLNPQVRAIVSSGYSVDEIMARHEAFGFVGVVTKPYDRDELIGAINAALSATLA